MKQVLITFAVAIIALVWLTDFVWRVLSLVWPVVAAALIAVVASAALAACIWLIGRSLRTLRPAPVPFEVIPANEAGQTFERAVRATFGPNEEAEACRHEDACRVAVMRFAWVGEHYGFGIGDLHPFITRKKRQVFIDLLTAKPLCVLVTGPEGTRWGPGWNYGGFRTAMQRRLIALPYPQGDLPFVDLNAAVERTRRTKRTRWSTPSSAGIAMSPTGAVYFSPMGNERTYAN